jgi:hypothetical protein
MNKFLSKIKKPKTTLVLLSYFIVFYLWYAMPFKSIDPKSANFHEALFRLRDYHGSKGTIYFRDEVLPNLFHQGTPKSYVDLMLSERGGATITDQSMIIKGAYFYSYKPLFLTLTPNDWIIDAYYDSNNMLVAMKFAGKRVINEQFRSKLINKQ